MSTMRGSFTRAGRSSHPQPPAQRERGARASAGEAMEGRATDAQGYQILTTERTEVSEVRQRRSEKGNPLSAGHCVLYSESSALLPHPTSGALYVLERGASGERAC